MGECCLSDHHDCVTYALYFRKDVVFTCPTKDGERETVLILFDSCTFPDDIKEQLAHIFKTRLYQTEEFVEMMKIMMKSDDLRRNCIAFHLDVWVRFCEVVRLLFIFYK